MGRRRLVVASAGLMLLVAACGSTASVSGTSATSSAPSSSASASQGAQTQAGGGLDLNAIAARLGVTVQQLQAAMATRDVKSAARMLGMTPEAMAKKLGVSVADIQAVLASGSTGTAAPTTSEPDTPSPSAATSSGAGNAIPNSWAGKPVDTTRLPIGTSHVSLSQAAVGGLYACDAGNPNGGGAAADGPWINEADGTWDMTRKLAVQGAVSWPMASYQETLTVTTRDITSNGVPVRQVTGTFPIAANDPGYAYDRNPNRISPGEVTVSLPLKPAPAASPTCLGKGRVGMARNGVPLFAPLDERNRDAVAYETQDSCDGHPQQAGTYHYHDIPSCIRDAAKGSSTVVGFANDGFPIVVERDASGSLPANADLDECHGRTSPIELDGLVMTMYHYSATYEFPYFIGCFRGTPIA